MTPKFRLPSTLLQREQPPLRLSTLRRCMHNIENHMLKFLCFIQALFDFLSWPTPSSSLALLVKLPSRLTSLSHAPLRCCCISSYRRPISSPLLPPLSYNTHLHTNIFSVSLSLSIARTIMPYYDNVQSKSFADFLALLACDLLSLVGSY